jgi:hypothetical protein
VAVDTLLGVVLAYLTVKYNKSDAPYDGTVHVTEDPESGLIKANMVLKNYENPAAIVNQDSVTFKVSNTPAPPPANGF